MRALTALSRFVSASFPFWVLLFAILAFFRPAWFLPLTAAIAPLLGLVMFGMGLTLKGEDFREVARHPIRVLIGVLAQFVIMPGLAWFGMPLAQRKALAIEVGMQNSGLGAALANAHFSPLAAVPSALFSVWHNLSGSLLAALFRRMEDTPR